MLISLSLIPTSGRWPEYLHPSMSDFIQEIMNNEDVKELGSQDHAAVDLPETLATLTKLTAQSELINNTTPANYSVAFAKVMNAFVSKYFEKMRSSNYSYTQLINMTLITVANLKDKNYNELLAQFTEHGVSVYWYKQFQQIIADLDPSYKDGIFAYYFNFSAPDNNSKMSKGRVIDGYVSRDGAN